MVKNCEDIDMITRSHTTHERDRQRGGALKMRERKTRNWKTRHHTARVENAGLENPGTTKYGKLNVT